MFLNSFLAMDLPTVFKVLSWGNLLFGFFIWIYRASQPRDNSSGVLGYYALAKFVQSVSWALILCVGLFRDIIVNNIGYSLLLIGLFIEARIIMYSSGFRNRWIYRFHELFFAITLVYFNYLEFSGNRSTSRLVSSQFLIMGMLSFPAIANIFSSRRSPLRLSIAFLYILFFVFAAIRNFELMFGIKSFLLHPKVVDSIIFLIFIGILSVGSTGFLLLVKEETDIKIREMAYLDHLTGLLNRRHFLEEGLSVFEHHARYQEVLAVVFLDLDHFKLINDTYGHSFGDDVLRDFSSIIRRNVRTSDLCCRYGGEEFILLLANSSRFRAVTVARRLQAAIGLSKFHRHPNFSYTTSIGIYIAIPRSAPGDTLDEFIEKSDAALYRAKANGRNCVEVFEDPVPIAEHEGT